MTRDQSVITVYNRYLTRGGEDEVFESELELLKRHGWRVLPVIEATRHPLGPMDHLRLGVSTLWSKRWYKKFQRLAKMHPASIVHVHNVFPVMSPSVYYAARSAGAAVVQTLHNYRMACPNALCYRDNHPCQDCVGRVVPWPGVVHRCYRQSRTQTAGVAAMLSFHRAIRTWQSQVDVYIALTDFSRRLLARAGLPADRIVVKPNFVHPDPGPKEERGDYCLFVGRLASQKGVLTMIRAWQQLSHIPLKVVGDPTTPDEGAKLSSLGDSPGIEYLGRIPRDQVFSLMHRARLLVFPSEWYEGFPLTIAEAFACGVPVVVSRLGAMAEIVEDRKTGLHFGAGDSDDLAWKIEWAWSNGNEVHRMSHEARMEYERKYTAEKNYRMLTEIYDRARRRPADREGTVELHVDEPEQP
jgi:glycosyltransferase involved in cell wall biosynthesis